jgi:hypothetical protein
MKKRPREVSTLLLLLFLWTIQSHDSVQSFCYQPLPGCSRKFQQIRTNSVTRQKLSRNNHQNQIPDRIPIRRRTKNLFFSTTPQILSSPMQTLSKIAVAASNMVSVTSDNEDESSFANKTSNELIAQAEALRAKAKAIRAEARAMEIALEETTSSRRKDKIAEIDGIIAALFSSKLSVSKASIQMATTTINGVSNVPSEPSPTAVPSIAVPDARVVADRLRYGRYSQDQVLAVVDRLFDLQARAMGQSTTATTIEVIPKFQIGNVDNVPTRNETTSVQYANYLEALADAARILDDGTTIPIQAYALSSSVSSSSPRTRQQSIEQSGRLEIAIRTRLKELRKIQQLNMNRRMAAELGKVVTATNNGSVEEYIRRTLGMENDDDDDNDLPPRSSGGGNKGTLHNITTIQSVFIPLWVPSTFLPYMVACNISTVGPREVEIIEKQVLMGSRFFMTSSASISGAALFRGNIRTNKGKMVSTDNRAGGGVGTTDNTTALVFEEIQNRLESVGLADKIQLFFMADPETPPRMEGTRPAVAAMEEDAKPVILALSFPTESLFFFSCI